MASPRKRRRRTLPRWSERAPDLHDYLQAPFQRTVAAVSKGGGPIVVTDDWPEFVPITDAELRVIEGHLAKELDELFGPLP